MSEQHLSIFLLDPKIFTTRVEDDDFKFKAKWKDLDSRLLGHKSSGPRVSEIGALVWNAKDGSGNEFLRILKDNYERLEPEPKMIVDELMRGNRIVRKLYREEETDGVVEFAEEEVELENVESITEACCDRIRNESESLDDCLSYGEFWNEDFIKRDSWRQYESPYQELDLVNQLKELRNVLLYSSEITIWDRNWEPEESAGYELTNEFFKRIKWNESEPTVAVTIHTDNRSRQQDDVAGTWDRSPLRRSGSYEDYCKRAGKISHGIRSHICFWRTQYIHLRAISSEFGGFQSSYGVQQLQNADQLYTPIPERALETLNHKFRCLGNEELQSKADLQKMRFVFERGREVDQPLTDS
jgi:hypothetical protein